MSSIEASYYENSRFWTGELFDEVERQRFDFVVSRIDSRVRSLLDVGCGNGLFLERVRTLRPDIEVLHGVDRSAAALARVGIPTTQASIDSLPFPDRSFDCVTCMEVVEHLPLAVYVAALSGLARVSARQLLITVPREQDLTVGRVECPECRTLFNPDYHLRSFSESSLAKLFDPHLLRLDEVVQFGIAEEYFLAPQIDAFKRHRPNRFDMDVPCPICGFVLAGRNAAASDGQETVKRRRSLRGLLKSLWPKTRSDRWLLADYRRATDRGLMSQG